MKTESKNWGLQRLVCFCCCAFGCRLRDVSSNLLNGTLPDSLAEFSSVYL
jgi:hypothetical protein